MFSCSSRWNFLFYTIQMLLQTMKSKQCSILGYLLFAFVLAQFHSSNHTILWFSACLTNISPKFRCFGNAKRSLMHTRGRWSTHFFSNNLKTGTAFIVFLNVQHTPFRKVLSDEIRANRKILSRISNGSCSKLMFSSRRFSRLLSSCSSQCFLLQNRQCPLYRLHFPNSLHSGLPESRNVLRVPPQSALK